MAPTWRPRSLQEPPKSAQEPSKIAQEPPKTTQEPPKNVQEPPKTAQECPRRPRSSPGAAQDSPRASQKPTKMPRSSPGPAQDLLRSRPGPARTARDPTHYLRLEKKSQLHNAILQNFFPSHKAAEIKNERRRYSPQGGLQSAAQLGTACWIRTSKSSCPSKPFQSQVPDINPSWILNVCLPPPKSSPSRPGPTPSSAAICGAGASWRLLGRKNGVPRGLQKMINF